MDDIPVANLLKELGNTKIDTSILDTLKELNKVIGEGVKTIDLVKRTGLLPLLIRGIGKKLDIDAESPLKSENTIIPKSDLHRAMLEQFNNLNEEQLKEVLQILQNVENKKK